MPGPGHTRTLRILLNKVRLSMHRVLLQTLALTTYLTKLLKKQQHAISNDTFHYKWHKHLSGNKMGSDVVMTAFKIQ